MVQAGKGQSAEQPLVCILNMRLAWPPDPETLLEPRSGFLWCRSPFDVAHTMDYLTHPCALASLAQQRVVL